MCRLSRSKVAAPTEVDDLTIQPAVAGAVILNIVSCADDVGSSGIFICDDDEVPKSELAATIARIPDSVVTETSSK